MSYEQLDWNSNIKNIDLMATNLIKKSTLIVKQLCSFDIKINNTKFISLLSDHLTEILTFASICNFLKNINDDNSILIKIESAENILDTYMSQFKNNKELFQKICQIIQHVNKNSSEFQFINKVFKMFKNEGIMLLVEDKKSYDKLIDKMKIIRNKVNNYCISYKNIEILILSF